MTDTTTKGKTNIDKNSATNAEYEPKFEWVAIYNDNSALKQHMDDKEWSSEDIDRKRLRQFMLIDENGDPVFIQRLKPGQQFIYRCRTAMRPGIGVMERIHIIGWREDRSEQIAFVFESTGLVELGEFVDPNSKEFEHKPWYYPINLKQHDFVLVE